MHARAIEAPLQCGVEVLSLEREPQSDLFRLTTTGGALEAKHVVVATGPFQRESIPELSTAVDSEIFQIHASRYFAPAQLPSGAVLVVGSGSSGCQIAEELLHKGRKVYLCVGRHRRIPRRYRGRDLMALSAFLDPTGVVADRSGSAAITDMVCLRQARLH
jgi:putative flavoprotein involved in K+ transport